MSETSQMGNESWIKYWGEDWVLEGCASCNGVFVLPPERVSQRCPVCGQAALAQMNATDNRPVYTQPPEMVVPFRAQEEVLRRSVSQFAKSVWLAPADLQESRLLGRLQSVYLPMWLVDVQVQGDWRAEMGFDYEIVSHREQFKNSGWQTERVKEKRVRWEPRLGRLNRIYDNQVAPALEQQAEIESKIGRFLPKDQKPFQPDDLTGTIVHLPNRPPEDAWNEAVVVVQTAVSQDCRLASEADHTRGFKWSPSFANQNWTQLLLPLYTSYYLDDDNQAQMVLLHGQSGKLHGIRRASMKQARRVAGIILAVAAVFLLVTLALLGLGFTVAEEALAWAGLVGVLAVGVGGTAVLPLLYAWYVNSIAKRP
ncbi:MAG: hypothetical protein H6654_14690 [Ardenticatenaceae bacterium]|nr:hypothetical protein [Anaerolineales bacterium]MCB8939047.1 hypothetical protein [Ardenticatenaceae bacterium]MCB8974803.1 hypothetical protein [Ardenticatenaceae bacterium]